MNKIFFALIMLFALSAEAQDSIAIKNQEKIKELKSRLGIMEKSGSSTSIDCATENASLRLRIQQLEELLRKGNGIRVYYETDAYNADYKKNHALDSIAKLAKTNLNYKITVAGYCDKTGAETSNLLLSKKRAASVRDFLVKEKGLNADNIQVEWYGSSSLITEYSKEYNNLLSRRTEIYLSF